MGHSQEYHQLNLDILGEILQDIKLFSVISGEFTLEWSWPITELEKLQKKLIYHEWCQIELGG